MKYDLILKNATALIPTHPQDLRQRSNLIKEKIDIGISQGKISELGHISPHQGLKVLDLNNLIILPGIIDSQVHFREPGLIHKEDLESGTRAALLGGVTTIFEMPNTSPSTTTKELFLDKLDRAKNRCHTNYAFYIGASEENADQLSQLESLPHCCGVKVFMGSSTGSLLVEDDTLLETILKNTQKRLVVHCEDEQRLKERKSLLQDHPTVALHPLWRDPITSYNAVKRLVTLAENLNRKVHVLHVTCQEEVEYLAHHRRTASVEVLPQHLTLFAPECYERLGTKAQQNPPIREKNHQEALWKALTSGVIDVIGSDHAPHTLEEKARPYPQTPSGMPGVQTLLPIMLNHVHNNKLSLEKLTALLTENVRDVFNIQNKGRIQIGFDADFTIIDPKKERRIENNWIQSKSKWTVFDGMKVTGWPMISIINGTICMQEDEILIPNSGTGTNFA